MLAPARTKTKEPLTVTWHTIGSFRKSDYKAVARYWDESRQSFRLRSSTVGSLTPQMRRDLKWYVAGWKIHLTIYPSDYEKARRAVQYFAVHTASEGLVFKYARSKAVYESFSGEVEGKFATIYCKGPNDIRPVSNLFNDLFTGAAIMPVEKNIIENLTGLRHELPLAGGFGFVRYGVFCYTNMILDPTEPTRHPFADNRHRPFPSFSNPTLLAKEIAVFEDLLPAPGRQLVFEAKE